MRTPRFALYDEDEKWMAVVTGLITGAAVFYLFFTLFTKQESVAAEEPLTPSARASQFSTFHALSEGFDRK